MSIVEIYRFLTNFVNKNKKKMVHFLIEEENIMTNINSIFTKGSLRKYLAAVLTVIISLVFVPETMAKADSEDMLMYEDRNFYGQSAPEIIELDVDCACISFYATCDGNTADTLTAYVVNLSSGSSNSFVVTANGTVDTSMTDFEAGEYRVFFLGSSSIKKTCAIMVFTEIDPWIPSND